MTWSSMTEANVILSGRRLFIVMTSLMLLIMLTGIDDTVLAAALVTITSKFNAVTDIPWITSSLFISQTCFTLLCGKILNIAPSKLVLVIATIIFIIGNLMCAIAPSFEFLIAGRVVTGLGATGIWVPVFSMIGRISVPTLRPILLGLISGSFCLSAIIGPVIGGFFTVCVSWRWCFYINLPIGGCIVVLLIIFVPNLPNSTVHETSVLHTWLKLDWIGALLNIIGLALCLVGSQLGGTIKPWNDPIVIVTVVTGVILLVLFVAWEERKGPDAILTTSMFRRRNIAGSFFITAFSRFIIVLATFYLPIIYQLRGYSAIRASIAMLPLIATAILGSSLSSVLISSTGHVWAWLFIPPFFSAVAFALLFISDISTSLAKLAGYQVLIGFSLGATQNAMLLPHTEYADQEGLISQATSLVSFGGLLFCAIGTATGGDVFLGILRNQVQKLGLDLSPSLQAQVLGSIDAVLALPENLRSPLIGAYLVAVKRSFLSGVVINILAGLSALLVERKRITSRNVEVPSASHEDQASAVSDKKEVRPDEKKIRSEKGVWPDEKSRVRSNERGVMVV